MTDDELAYSTHVNLRHWYDKLWLSKELGYFAGNTPIPKNSVYIIRPRINLHGCGLNAKIGFCNKDKQIPLHCFWSEVFHGDHMTIDYTLVNEQWVQGSTFIGFNTWSDLVHFSSWNRHNMKLNLPPIFDELKHPSNKLEYINIELIGKKIIEVHLRSNSDPVMYDNFIPIWDEGQVCPNDYIRIDDRQSHIDRLGFFVKNN